MHHTIARISKYSIKGLGRRVQLSYSKPNTYAMKKPHLWLAVLATWLLCIATLQYPLMAVLIGPLSVLQRGSLIIFLGWVNFAWLYGIYQIAVLVFAAVASRLSHSTHFASCQGASVAVLYTTMNDFSEKAAMSCVNQNYSQFHVFLLDDSTKLEYQLKVEAFHARFPETTTIVRRESQEGFKAGNLNHALRLISVNYEFFAICDADGVLPPDFISKTLAHFVDESIGFVQARQRAMTKDGVTRFAASLAVGVDVYWEHIVPPTQTFGFVLFHGHGGIIRTRIWSEIGGFPTVVAEDLAFSTRIRERGYIGVIANDVICEEEFPSSYDAFSKRQLKYARGAVEHLRAGMWSFLYSSKITWFEKIDRFLASLAMVSALPLLFFLLDLALILPIAFSLPTSQTHSISESPIPIWGLLSMDNTYLPVFTWPLAIMTIFTLLAPLAPVAYHLWHSPVKFVRYVVASVAVHLSLVIGQSWDTLVVAATGKNFFSATGDRTDNGQIGGSGRTIGNRRLSVIRVLGAFILLTAAILSANIGILPICFATGVGIAIDKLGWEHALVRVAILLPITVVILLIILGCSKAVGLSGLSILAATSSL